MMRRVLLVDAIVAALLGVTMSVIIWELWLLPLGFVGLFSLRRYSRRSENSNRRLALAGIAVTLLVFLSIVFAARAYEPAKIIHKLEGRRIDLPSDEITLADLAWLGNYDGKRFPVLTRFTFPIDKRNEVVHFLRPDPTLREFVDVLESKHGLSHRFHGCLNGTSILGGPGPSHLYLEMPCENSEKRFDVAAHSWRPKCMKKRSTPE